MPRPVRDVTRWMGIALLCGAPGCSVEPELARVVDAGMEAGVDAGPAPTTCASGSIWTESSGDTGPTMAPGYACRSCHLRQAPTLAYYFMGTVFPTLHEKDGCDARLLEPSRVKVEILDAEGQVRLTLVPNAAGNVLSTTLQPSFPLPYRARLVGPDGTSRTMVTPQSSGDCNTCHTEQGTQGAPGRIALP
ncbi:hypothetical protein HMI49_06085 [Corallococcus exercitus]|uniref:Uncharacterized protein n=1 Tax=Corallococcus exercitus TaxID=2316736 RepID=A0A7Y4NQJ3_9BACT|nr:hypothetical protein [Corallococcus exercitus]NOK32766.1 hypothetical protein [Corallococcus exercitus]